MRMNMVSLRFFLILLGLLLASCLSPFSDTFTIHAREWQCPDSACQRKQYLAKVVITVNKVTATAAAFETTESQDGWGITRNYLISNCSVVDEDNWRCEPFEMVAGRYSHGDRQAHTGLRYWLNWSLSWMRR
jgi:hypothetical protein